MPNRIQRKRTKGWVAPVGAKYAGRSHEVRLTHFRSIGGVWS